jgi:hypothetical protein
MRKSNIRYACLAVPLLTQRMIGLRCSLLCTTVLDSSASHEDHADMRIFCPPTSARFIAGVVLIWRWASIYGLRARQGSGFLWGAHGLGAWRTADPWRSRFSVMRKTRIGSERIFIDPKAARLQ